MTLGKLRKPIVRYEGGTGFCNLHVRHLVTECLGLQPNFFKYIVGYNYVREAAKERDRCLKTKAKILFYYFIRTNIKIIIHTSHSLYEWRDLHSARVEIYWNSIYCCIMVVVCDWSTSRKFSVRVQYSSQINWNCFPNTKVGESIDSNSSHW